MTLPCSLRGVLCPACPGGHGSNPWVTRQAYEQHRSRVARVFATTFPGLLWDGNRSPFWLDTRITARLSRRRNHWGSAPAGPRPGNARVNASPGTDPALGLAKMITQLATS